MGLEFHPAIERVREKWRSTPFDWNGACCMMSVCDYVTDRWGIDPATPWRGTYSTEAGARAIYAPFGGPLGVFRHGMERAGFVECEAYEGAPVIVDLMGHEIAGIYLGRRTMMRIEGRGMIDWPAPVLGAWKCE